MSDISPYAPVEIHRFVGSRPGPRLLILGAVHGIEVCGAIAIQKIIRALSRNELKITAGQVTFIPVANPEAFAIRKRYSGRDLNRGLSYVMEPRSGADFFANIICDVMADNDILLDIHSFSADGDAFIFVGPENNISSLEPFEMAEQELSFAKTLGVKRMVYGWFAAYDQFAKDQEQMVTTLESSQIQHIRKATSDFGRGTTEYFRSLGGKYGVTLESGQHLSENSISVATRAIERALQSLGITESNGDFIAESFTESFCFKRIYIRENVHDKLAKPFSSFTPVKRGDPLGYRSSGRTLLAPSDGAVIFAYEDAKVGNEWIYFAEKSLRGCS